ncbi:LysR family transcriptional regulator [Actinophytocola algeriensis]|uniref:DNA-binding transcriptional LysR family regulator n=1 Tax=Actinophytocola algeriensis TaxID=1768010 RepID=A0A7W7Q7W7_9PSEU|nr:LysR family transcriptional regulator [Actinophytocola algeriensis]MBB4908483.1 DNA-binding transcriptional LysR family regulator [Actinophytocola algeriensis]MBE1475130.1 DNA-binding transcriptional LysR family regulator [Actinophytocola algeriensis]
MRVERARYFLAAVETGSLRSAAARCGVSQPTVGQQIALLEEELDVVLMTRSRRGVRPTAAGQALLEPLRRLVAAEEAVRESATESGGAYAGGVHIGGVSVTAETIIAPVVGHLRAHRPGLRFTVREGASADIEAAVLAGDLDFGVITTPSHPARAGLHRVPLISAPVGVLAPADHPLAGRDHVDWADLASWPIVTMRAGTVLWDVLHRHVPRPDVVVQAMSARTLKVMVAQGAGLGLLGGFDTSADIPDVVWLPVRDAAPIRLCLVQRKDSQPSRAALIVRRLIKARADELADRAASVEHP